MKWIYIAVFILVMLLPLSGCTVTYENIGDAIRDGATLGEHIIKDGIDVSGLSVADARALLRAKQDDFAASLTYDIAAGGRKETLNALSFSPSWDTDEVLLRAMALMRHSPTNTPARTFATSFTVSPDIILSRLEAIAKKLYVAPSDAYAAYDPAEEGRFAYVEDVDGMSIKAADMAPIISEALARCEGASIAPKPYPIQADYPLDDAKRDTSLISEFSTSFSGSTYGKANRVHNIAKAAGLIDGVVIAPGEEFNMNAVLGPRNAANGWLEAAGILNAKYVQEYGGGVCQVSTTLYNAALMADLDMAERVHHSWPLGYIDIGRDATISTGGPNLRFVNDSESTLYISASTDKKKKTITVRIYGRPLEDGITIKLKSKKVEHIPNPGEKIVLDASLPYNTRVEEREARSGSVAETYRIYYDASGNEIKRSLVSRDKYRAFEGLIYVSADIFYARDRASVSDGATGDGENASGVSVR